MNIFLKPIIAVTLVMTIIGAKSSAQTGTYSVRVREQNADGSIDKWNDTIWIDSVFVGAGFSHGNYFSKCDYKTVPGKNFSFQAAIVRADAEALVWSGSVRRNKIKGKAEWYRSGKVKTTYRFKGKKIKS